MLKDYLNGQNLLVSTAFNTPVLQYRDGSFQTTQILNSRGIGVGKNIVFASAGTYTYCRPDGSLGALVYSEDRQPHEMVYDSTGKLWITDTLGSALMTIDTLGNRTELWRAPSIDESTDDRIHLNGVALRDGVVRYVTCIRLENQPNSWRDTLGQSVGVAIDITTNQPVATELYSPHSPRWHDGFLYVCEAGNGNVIKINPDTGDKQTITTVQGWARGLQFTDNYMLIGQSQGRASGAANIPPERLLAPPGIQAFDLTTKQLVHFEPVNAPEIMDIQLTDLVIQ